MAVNSVVLTFSRKFSAQNGNELTKGRTVIAASLLLATWKSPRNPASQLFVVVLDRDAVHRLWEGLIKVVSIFRCIPFTIVPFD